MAVCRREGAEMLRLKKYLWILLGNGLITLGLGQVVLANGFIAGGVTGLSLVLQHIMPLDIAILTGLVNTLLFLAGAVLLGKEFAFSTALSALVFPFFLQLFTKFSLFPELTQDWLLATIIGGVAIGCGIGLVIGNNGSTGGVDVLSLLLHKYCGVQVSKAMAVMDVSIILLQLIWQQNTGVLYGILVVLLTSFMLNQTLAYGDVKVQALIISKQHEQIRQAILQQCDSGVTLLTAVSGYERLPQQVLLTVVPYKSLVLVKQAIKNVDANAIVIISTVREVNGRGYSMAR